MTNIQCCIRSIRHLLVVLALCVTIAAPALSQAGTDSVAVVTETLRHFTAEFDDGLFEKRISRFGFDSRPFEQVRVLDRQGQVIAYNTEWRSQRQTAAVAAILAGTRAVVADPAEAQAMMCETKVVMDRSGQSCTMRDYDVIITCSNPIFRGETQAQVYLQRTQNVKNKLGTATHKTTLLYTLERVKGKWTVLGRVPV